MFALVDEHPAGVFDYDSNPSRLQPYQKEGQTKSLSFFFGGDGGIRTLDLTDANRTLSQLSYAPKSSRSIIIAQKIDL